MLGNLDRIGHRRVHHRIWCPLCNRVLKWVDETWWLLPTIVSFSASPHTALITCNHHICLLSVPLLVMIEGAIACSRCLLSFVRDTNTSYCSCSCVLGDDNVSKWTSWLARNLWFEIWWPILLGLMLLPHATTATICLLLLIFRLNELLLSSLISCRLPNIGSG